MSALATLRKWAEDGNGEVQFLADSPAATPKWRVVVSASREIKFEHGTPWLASVEEAANVAVGWLTEIGEVPSK